MQLKNDTIFSKKLMNQAFESKLFASEISSMLVLLRYSDIIIWIPVAIWIYIDSKKDNFLVPLLWAFLILLASYQGVIIYLMLRLIMSKEIIKENS